MVDAADSKSVVERREGSSPSWGTSRNQEVLHCSTSLINMGYGSVYHNLFFLNDMTILLHLLAFVVAFYILTIISLSFFIRVFLRHKDVKRDFTHIPTVSVLMSAFNEGPAVYNTIKSLRENDYPIDRLEILAFDDRSSDDTFEWITKAAKDFPNVKAILNVKNQGKALTMIDAATMARGEYIVGVDSDCVFKKDAIRQLMACFTEDRIRAVGGRVGISNIDESWLCEVQTLFYFMSFTFLKSIENYKRKVQCLSGPIVAMKRDFYLSLEEKVRKRTFLGAKITNGEDRALTQMILREGYDTYVNMDAVCWTSAPTDLSQYMKQQLRWRRSALGQWIDTLFKMKIMINNSSFISALFSVLPVYVVLCWNAMIITSFFTGLFLVSISQVLIFHILLGPFLALLYIYLARHEESDMPKDKIKFFMNSILASFWFPFSGFVITMVALFTLDDGGWVTRS